MGRLHRVDPNAPGISRSRHGKGFSYLDRHGRIIDDPDVRDRIRGLAIPPAWRDVWICPDPDGHIQATGIDQAGRKQYIYSERWRAGRDRLKFERMLRFSEQLPDLRARVERDLTSGLDLTRDRVLACAVRLLDIGLFRVGSETYAKSNGSFGLATLRKEHVRVEDDEMAFRYTAKGGKKRLITLTDPEAARVVGSLKRRRGGGGALLAYRADASWLGLRSGDINGYLKEVAGDGFSAKDFRTWHATVLAAVFLAEADGGPTRASNKGVVSSAIAEVSGYLGNTPAVCRRSYIDPRVIERFSEGKTIAPSLRAIGDGVGADERRHSVEAAVRALIYDEAVVDAA